MGSTTMVVAGEVRKVGAMGLSWAALCITLLSMAAGPVAAEVYGKSYRVGDSTGWTYINGTSGKPADYEAWAAKYVFFVNDILDFHYEPNKQNIYSFDSYDAWKSCNLTGAQLLDKGSSGFSQWFLPYEGYYDFASGIYCAKGQKFRIYAVNASSVPFVSPSIPSTAPAPYIAPSASVSPAPSSGADEPNTAPSMDLPNGGPEVPILGPPGGNSAPSSSVQSSLLLLAGTAVSVVAIGLV